MTAGLLVRSGISQVAAACMQGKSQVLVMELCCTDLAAALERARWRWDEALIRALLRQLLQGVAACHRAGAAHGPAGSDPSVGCPSPLRCIVFGPALRSPVHTTHMLTV